MREGLKLLVAAVTLVFGVIWATQPNRPNNWEFISKVTQLRFPAETKLLFQYDNGEWYVNAVVRLPEGSVLGFAKAHGFKNGTLRNDAHESIFQTLPGLFQKAPRHPEVLFAEGLTTYNSWFALLDLQTRHLWIYVTYPDWSGDHSGTGPQPFKVERALRAR